MEEIKAQFEQICTACASSNNAIREQAEKQLAEVCKQRELYLQLLINAFESSKSLPVRQLAGILLKQALSKAPFADESGGVIKNPWMHASSNTQSHVKASLLRMLMNETLRSMRRTTDDAVASLAILILRPKESRADEDWEELFPCLFTMFQRPSPPHQQSALFIIDKLVEFVYPRVSHHRQAITELLNSALHSYNSEVKVTAVSALNSLLFSVPYKEAAMMSDSIVMILQAIVEFAQKGDDDSIVEALSAITDTLKKYPKLFRSHLNNIVDVLEQIASNKAFDDATRRAVLNFLIHIAEFGKGMARRNPSYCQKVALLPFQFCLAGEVADWQQFTDNFEFENENLRMGIEALDRLSLAIGGKKLLPIITPHIQRLVCGQEWLERFTGLLAIAGISEGCAKELTKDAETILRLAQPFVVDPSVHVRWAAVSVFQHMCLDLAPVCQESHAEVVLGTLVGVLQEAGNPYIVQIVALESIHDFFSKIEEFDSISNRDQLLELSRAALQAVFSLLSVQNLRIQQNALSVVSIIAEVIGSEFSQYYSLFMPGVKKIIEQAVSSECRLLRGIAMECVGLMGNAVGKEIFAVDAEQIMGMLFATQKAGLKSDDPQYGYMIQAFRRICECMGNAFIPYLPVVIPPLIASAKLNDTVCVPDDDDDDDDDDDNILSHTSNMRGIGTVTFRINTAIFQEKAHAITMLYQYANKLQSGFFPFCKETVHVMIPLMDYALYPAVRNVVVASLPILLRCAKTALLENNQSLDMVEQLFTDMFVPFISVLVSEPDVQTLCSIVLYLSECIDCVGYIDPQRAAAVAEGVSRALMDRESRLAELKEQEQDEDFDEEQKAIMEDAVETEDELLSMVIQLNTVLCIKCKHEYYEPFNKFIFPCAAKYLHHESSETERMTGLCLMEDILEHCGPQAIKTYLADFTPIAFSYLLDPAYDVQQAACYAAGVIGQVSGDFFAPYIDDVCKQLISIITNSNAEDEASEGVRCCAVSAFGKICESHTQRVDQNQVWKMFLSWLPVGGDEDEALVCHNLLCRLIERNSQFIFGTNNENMPQILSVLIDVFETDEKLHARIFKIWTCMKTQLPHDVLKHLVSAIPPDRQEKMHNLGGIQ